MHKLIAVLVSLSFTAGLVGCGRNSAESNAKLRQELERGFTNMTNTAAAPKLAHIKAMYDELAEEYGGESVLEISMKIAEENKELAMAAVFFLKLHMPEPKFTKWARNTLSDSEFHRVMSNE
ncbi:MAG: hypothetical protein QGG42_21330 [Phycisphaerae bacterium]|jgi:hypothetical protein|nr:hypothetical protein [Phycisphaerae bacterium]